VRQSRAEPQGTLTPALCWREGEKEGRARFMSDRSLVPKRLLEFARNLRRGQSKAEAILWAFLRDRRLLGLKFRRQHPMGPYIADFFCSELNWVIELDGGQHNTDEARGYDTRRSEFLQRHGVEVTRFWNNEVAYETEAVVERLLDLAKSMTARAREDTLTPALSQRERENGCSALSQRERENGCSAHSRRENERRVLSESKTKHDKE